MDVDVAVTTDRYRHRIVAKVEESVDVGANVIECKWIYGCTVSHIERKAVVRNPEDWWDSSRYVREDSVRVLIKFCCIAVRIPILMLYPNLSLFAQKKNSNMLSDCRLTNSSKCLTSVDDIICKRHIGVCQRMFCVCSSEEDGIVGLRCQEVFKVKFPRSWSECYYRCRRLPRRVIETGNRSPRDWRLTPYSRYRHSNCYLPSKLIPFLEYRLALRRLPVLPPVFRHIPQCSSSLYRPSERWACWRMC